MRLHKFYNAIIIAVLVTFASTACFKMDMKLEDIENGINFSLVELYEGLDSRPIPALILYTNDEYDCGNNAIYQNVWSTETSMEIEIEGYKETSNCVNTSGPATSIIPIYAENGSYDLNIKYDSHTDKYAFHQSDDALEVHQLGGFSFSQPNYETFWRYPEKSFAVLVGTSEENENLYTKVIEELKNEFEIREIHFPESGETPYLKSLDSYNTNHPAKYFKYESEEDYLHFGNFIRNFGYENITDYNENKVVIVNWLNKTYTTEGVLN